MLHAYLHAIILVDLATISFYAYLNTLSSLRSFACLLSNNFMNESPSTAYMPYIFVFQIYTQPYIHTLHCVHYHIGLNTKLCIIFYLFNNNLLKKFIHELWCCRCHRKIIHNQSGFPQKIMIKVG